MLHSWLVIVLHRSLQSSLIQHKDTLKPVHSSLTAMHRVESKVGTEVGVGIQIILPSFQTPTLGSVEHEYEASVGLGNDVSGLVV
jgi:hypothetical protein